MHGDCFNFDRTACTLNLSRSRSRGHRSRGSRSRGQPQSRQPKSWAAAVAAAEIVGTAVAAAEVVGGRSRGSRSRDVLCLPTSCESLGTFCTARVFFSWDNVDIVESVLATA